MRHTLGEPNNEIVGSALQAALDSASSSGDLKYLGQDAASKTAAYWDQVANSKSLQAHWWDFPRIIAHINQRICGEPVMGACAGIIKLLRDRYESRLPFQRGISVGCANGWKEMELLQAGIVESFDLFELSPAMIAQGQGISAERGLEERIMFHQQDAFAAVTGEELFDFVYWDNALHHMLDVEAALVWSKKVLRKGGVLCMYDFVGPTRGQWSARTLDIATSVRNLLEERRLASPWPTLPKFSRVVTKLSAEELTKQDPSEMADCGRILGCMLETFPNAKVINTGGVVYFAALSGLLANFHEQDDGTLIDSLLLVDDLAADSGETLYAFAHCVKDSAPVTKPRHRQE
jgi:SAM-dependent methyltransferase